MVQRKKKKYKQIFPRPRRWFQHFLTAGIILTALFITSFIISYAGDSLLLRDEYKKAKQFYTLASFLNPFSQKAKKGIVIADTTERERHYIGQPQKKIFIKNTKDLVVSDDTKVAPAYVVKIPVLMYHYIRVNPVKEDLAGYYLSVTPEDFDAQMKFLVDHGYKTITMNDLLSSLLQTKQLPQKPILITFDDGYRDSFTNAFPVLKKYELKAVNFIPTSFIGTNNYLTWEMIREMQTSGVFSFGSHTMTHLSMTYGSNEVVLYELVESRKILEKELGTSIEWFAYPFGHMDERVSELVKEAGYYGAFGTSEGIEHSLDYIYSLPRVRIGGGMSLEMFAAKLPWR